MNGIRFHIISPSRVVHMGRRGVTCILYVPLERGDQNFACAEKGKKTPHTRTASRMTSRKSSSPDLPEGYMTRASRASPVQANTNIGLRLE